MGLFQTGLSFLDPPECFQTVVPAEVLSLVGAVLPGQQVLALNPMLAGQTLLQTSAPGTDCFLFAASSYFNFEVRHVLFLSVGVSSVSLNVPTSITNQQLHLTTLPHPPTGEINSGSAPLTITELSGNKLTKTF